MLYNGQRVSTKSSLVLHKLTVVMVPSRSDYSLLNDVCTVIKLRN